MLALNSKADNFSSEEGLSFLPDFCNLRIILLVMLSAELLAFILAFAAIPHPHGLWIGLLLISLFVQVIAISNMIVLCLSRRWLERVNPFNAALGGYGLSLLVTLVVSLGVAFFLPILSDYLPLAGFVIRNLAISAIVSAVALRYFYVQHQWKQNFEAQARSQIQALQARIRPHFLFNSMNTIASLTRTNPVLAEKTVEDLADLFRASIGHQDTIKLEEELQFTRRYINIEQLRLSDRLEVEWHISEDVSLDAPIPALILQPLVENAIYHGIEPQTTGGVVSISVIKVNNRLEFIISNPLPKVVRAYQQRKGNNMAQENIRLRLKLAYGGRASLQVVKTDDRYTVTFSIPIEGLSYESTGR